MEATAVPLGKKYNIQKGAGRDVCCMDYRTLRIRKANRHETDWELIRKDNFY